MRRLYEVKNYVYIFEITYIFQLNVSYLSVTLIQVQRQSLCSNQMSAFTE